MERHDVSLRGISVVGGLTRCNCSRDFEREILPMARHFGMALAPWDVVGGGRLQSKKQASYNDFRHGYT